MSEEAILEVCRRFREEPEFRQRLRDDSEATVQQESYDLDDDELAALSRVDWSLSDEEIMRRPKLVGWP